MDPLIEQFLDERLGALEERARRAGGETLARVADFKALATGWLLEAVAAGVECEMILDNVRGLARGLTRELALDAIGFAQAEADAFIDGAIGLVMKIVRAL